MYLNEISYSQSEGISGQIAGQCQCKTNVIGMQCDTCEDGFFGLSPTNPQGCSPCNCNTDGTVSSSVSCHATTGQCQCKQNVMGLKCDQCVGGTTGLNPLNALGCSDCDCNATGSLSSVCHPDTGVCQCKPGVGGDLCSECLDGYFDFSDAGCRPCTCNDSGAISNVCNKETGVCACLPNVGGENCDTCSSGYYSLEEGCLDCECNTNGTVNGSILCQAQTGQCQCKENVMGRTCDTCISGYTGLQASSDTGCVECDCSVFGTDQNGSICDPVTSQCDCLPSTTGNRCDECIDGFYSTLSGCVECGCNSEGSSSSVCDAETGQCACMAGVGGRECSSCQAGFFGFPR